MEPLLPERQYHIYNHVIGNDLLFKEEKNYFFYLEKYENHITPVAETFAYCLMPNHFHVLVQIKKEKDIISSFKKESLIKKYNALGLPVDKENFISLYVSKQFSNLFSSYAQAYNKMYKRMGSLFLKNFKRKHVASDDYFIKLINYIHNNPVKHGFVLKPEEWKFSSYNAIISDLPTLVERRKVIEVFGDLENFIFCHQKMINI